MRLSLLLQATSCRRIIGNGGMVLARVQRRTFLEAQALHEQPDVVPFHSSSAFGSSELASRHKGGQLRVHSQFLPSGDQPTAINEIVQEFNSFPLERRFVTLAGATGTGKTFVMAHVIAQLKSPALVLCHSKVLAQQQYAELKALFPDGSVRLFESPFLSFTPRSVDPVTGKLKRSAESGRAQVDVAASIERDSALMSLLEDDSSSLVIVATVAALFSFSASMHLPLDELERTDVCSKIQELADRRLMELCQQEAKRNLQKTIANDLTSIRKNGNCASLYEKYGALLPHRVARISVVDQLSHRFGCQGWLAIVDESHQMLRAISSVSEARSARLSNLIEWGYQLPTGADRGCFSKDGFMASLPLKTLFVSATPAPEEQYLATKIVQMVIRPSNIVDPKIELASYSFEHLVEELQAVGKASGQVLINCRTHRQVEQVLAQIQEAVPMFQGRAGHLKYTLPRSDRAKLMNKFNVTRELSILAGVGMLAEGLSFPHVNLVVVMQADCGGLFRTEEKLTQFAGRATRNPDARVLFYVRSDESAKLPVAVQRCIAKSERRRAIQLSHNDASGFIPCRTALAKSACGLFEEDSDIAPAEMEECPELDF